LPEGRQGREKCLSVDVTQRGHQAPIDRLAAQLECYPSRTMLGWRPWGRHQPHDTPLRASSYVMNSGSPAELVWLRSPPIAVHVAVPCRDYTRLAFVEWHGVASRIPGNGQPRVLAGRTSTLY
jgi:hypothetical protein